MRALLACLIPLVLLSCECEPTFAQAERYRAALTREAQFRFGIPAPVPAIAAQINQESRWNPQARSQVGAQGLMQIMPGTAAWATQQAGFGAADPLNPIWAIRAGVWYDRWLYDRIKTFDTECDRWSYVLSSYNGGLGYVYKRQHLSPDPGSYTSTGGINPGIAAASQHENETYAPLILQHHQPLYRLWGKTVCL